MECQRAKMLFDSKNKAINFIKFNSDEIKNVNGIAPKRAYFCKSCGGWHVTSRPRPVSERGQIKNWIGKAYQMVREKNWPSAQRCLCYASDGLRLVNERLIASPFDDTLKKEINKAKKILDNTVSNQRKILSSAEPAPMFRYLDLNYDSFELEVEHTWEDPVNKGIQYVIRPKLLTQYNDKFYYMICTCRLNEEEIRMTKELNGMNVEDDSIQRLICHSLNMVEINHSFSSDNKNQYESVPDAFTGDILAMWTYGMRLRIVEKVKDNNKYFYHKRSSFDYWIKLGERNVHFYLGRSSKYTCVESQLPLDFKDGFKIYKKSTNN